MQFSQPLIKTEVWFFWAHSSHIWASILWIFCPSVCQSVYKKQICKNRETWISELLFQIGTDSFFSEDSCDQRAFIILIFYEVLSVSLQKVCNITFCVYVSWYFIWNEIMLSDFMSNISDLKITITLLKQNFLFSYLFLSFWRKKTSILH